MSVLFACVVAIIALVCIGYAVGFIVEWLMLWLAGEDGG